MSYVEPPTWLLHLRVCGGAHLIWISDLTCPQRTSWSLSSTTAHAVTTLRMIPSFPSSNPYESLLGSSSKTWSLKKHKSCVFHTLWWIPVALRVTRPPLIWPVLPLCPHLGAGPWHTDLLIHLTRWCPQLSSLVLLQPSGRNLNAACYLELSRRLLSELSSPSVLGGPPSRPIPPQLGDAPRMHDLST